MREKIKESLSAETVSRLQRIRRVNAGIRGCIEILNEHGANEPSIPSGAKVFIRLEGQQEMGLLYAIEACSRTISDELDNRLEDDFDVYWLDQICPEVTAEAQAHAEMMNGDITYAEFEKRAG